MAFIRLSQSDPSTHTYVPDILVNTINIRYLEDVGPSSVSTPREKRKTKIHFSETHSIVVSIPIEELNYKLGPLL